jgi:nucleoside-triphosphatase
VCILGNLQQNYMNVQRKLDERVFLVTGKPRMGKSTSIKNIISLLDPDICGGFYTEEIRDLNDRIGFRCVSVDGGSQEIANVDNNSPVRVGRYGIDLKKFEDFAIKQLETSLNAKKVIVIDEIGYMQLLSKPFEEMIMNIVTQSNHILLGTIPVDSHPIIHKIRNHNRVKIFSINHDNRELLPEELAKRILRAIEY